MNNKILISVAGLAAFVSYCFYRGHCAKTTRAEVKQDLHRWEDEGGNVPHVATPSPVSKPHGNYPGNGASAGRY
jgi:hypothetical protein